MRHPHSTAYLVPVALGALLLGAALGCGEDFQSSGDDTTSSGSGGSGAGGGVGGTTTTSSTTTSGSGGGLGTCVDLGEACSQCEIAACPEIYCNCYENPACQMVIYCLIPCGPGLNSCSQNCYTLHSAGIADAALAGHCAATHCAADCFAGLVPIPDCDYCLFDGCETEINACLADPSCAQLLYCAQGCDSPDCVDGCQTSFPGGVSLATPLRQCMNDHCSSDCAWAG